MAMAASAAPFLGDEVFVCIASHLRCRELGRLARSAARFSLLKPIVGDEGPSPSGVPELRSIAQEGARLVVRRAALGPSGDRVPRSTELPEDWLQLLRELERLQRTAFTLAGPEIVLSEGGAVALRLSGGETHAQRNFLQSAVCGGANLRAGRHFVEITWVGGPQPRADGLPPVSSAAVAEALGLAGVEAEEDDDEDDPLLLGVCGVDFDPTVSQGGAPSMASNDESTSLLCGRTGRLRQYRGSREDASEEQDWPGRQRTAIGDVIGLLLDLDEGSLAVYRNGERCGLMVRSGLVAPLRWCVDLDPEENTQVRVVSAPVPRVSVEMKAHEDEVWKARMAQK